MKMFAINMIFYFELATLSLKRALSPRRDMPNPYSVTVNLS